MEKNGIILAIEDRVSDEIADAKADGKNFFFTSLEIVQKIKRVLQGHANAD